MVYKDQMECIEWMGHKEQIDVIGMMAHPEIFHIKWIDQQWIDTIGWLDQLLVIGFLEWKVHVGLEWMVLQEWMFHTE